MNIISTSKEDIESLSQYSLNVQQVSERICSLVMRAEEIFSQIKQHKVELDEQIAVILSFGRERGVIKCRFCDHQTSSPGEITIVNIHTKAKITFDEHSLHQLRDHYYFGVDQHRIDPIEACSLLGLK